MQQTPTITRTHKHPASVWCMAAASACYCFTFGMITSLLVLYMLEHFKFPTSKAYDVFAAINSLLFTLPLIGGYIAGKLGYKYATVIGLIVTTIGTFILSIHTLPTMYLGIAAFITGNALLTPAMYAIVGLIYSAQDVRRDSGYTLYYLIFNIGFLVSVTAAGYLSKYFGYNVAFLFAAIANVLALLVFLASIKIIQPSPEHSMKPQVAWKPWQIVAGLVAAAIIGLPITLYLIEHTKIDNILLWMLAIGASIGIIIAAFKQQDKLVRYRLLAFLMLAIISIAFWALYMLEPSLLAVFILQNVDRHVLGHEIPAASYYALDALFVILLGIVFSWMWRKLAEKGRDISLPAKFASSLIAMGIGYLIFVVGISFAGADYLTASGWVVLGYAFLASAELLISPIGLSMVGRLMPKGKDGLGMGIWQTFTGLSAVISGYLANMANVPSEGTPSAAQTNPIFHTALLKIGSGTFVIGIIAILLIPLIKRLIAEPSKQI